jgi:putative nucleotidyltransferase with HDIG domain
MPQAAVPHIVATSRIRGIDEDLWFGNFSDEEAEKKAAESVAAMVGRIVGAKPFPIAAQRLAEATRDPDCDLNDVIRILERDVALSTRLLRLVNSASFALRTPCTSVRQATSLVGTDRLNQLATTAAILDMVDSSSVQASKILEHSSVVGALCRYLAVHLGLPADELFTCGFLHDIGKLMLLETESKRYVPLLQEVGHEYDSIHLYEREMFGFDHALLAGHVLSRWAIPEPVPKVVAWHHHVTRAYDEGPRFASLVSVLRLADLLSYSLASDNDEAEVERVARSESASYLDISAAQLAAVWDEMRSLQERSSALFRGEEPPEVPAPVSLRPGARLSRAMGPRSLRAGPASNSLEPRPRSEGHQSLADAGGLLFASAPMAVHIQEAPDGPKQFPCVVCAGPSFANNCLACHGYVCPDHQRGAEGWCDLCWREFQTESHNWRLRPVLSLIVGAGIGATVVGGFFSAASGHSRSSLALLIGPLVGTGIVAGLVAILHRYAQRAWFLKTRPNRAKGEGLEDAPESVRAAANAARAGSSRAALDAAEFEASTGTERSLTAGDLDEAPLVAEARRFAARGYGSATTPLRQAIGLGSDVTISDAGSNDGNWPASLAPPARPTTAPVSSRRPQGSSGAPIASVLPWSDGSDGGRSSVAPEGSAAADSRASSFAPSPSIVPGSKEAEERGRALKLLSEHDSRRDEGSGPRAPSSSPQISVQPMFGGPVRGLGSDSQTPSEGELLTEALRSTPPSKAKPSLRASAAPSSWSNPRASREFASQRARTESAEPGVSLLAPARRSAAPKSGDTLLGAGPTPQETATQVVANAERRDSRLPIDSTFIAEAVIGAASEPPGRRPSEGPPPSGRRASQWPSAGPARNTSAPPPSRRTVAPAKFPSVGPGSAAGSSALQVSASAAAEAGPIEGPEAGVEESASPLESGIVPAEAPAPQLSAPPAPEPSEPWRNLLGSTGTADGW